ncbi:MAG TPA: hypothetical protein VGO43_16060 [Pyrinomonadaceae bacterium]|jgi:hypothetical protein|nr:hypothetical protein [Pyrinomonadaceae bacterium]
MLLTFTFEDMRAVLEVLSFVATIALGIFGFLVLSQLRLAKASLDTAKETLEAAKADMQTRIEREAVVLAAAQIDILAKEIIPTSSHLVRSLREAGLRDAPWELDDHELKNTSLKEPEKAREWVKDTIEKKISVVDLMNQLEAFAIYFVGGAADEKVAFSCAAAVFCADVELVAPFLVMVRVTPRGKFAIGPYENTVALYQLWAARVKKEALDTQAARLLAESKDIHLSEIPILGRK